MKRDFQWKILLYELPRGKFNFLDFLFSFFSNSLTLRAREKSSFDSICFDFPFALNPKLSINKISKLPHLFFMFFVFPSSLSSAPLKAHTVIEWKICWKLLWNILFIFSKHLGVLAWKQFFLKLLWRILNAELFFFINQNHHKELEFQFFSESTRRC